jgi:hypothetical protein
VPEPSQLGGNLSQSLLLPCLEVAPTGKLPPRLYEEARHLAELRFGDSMILASRAEDVTRP